MAILLFYIGVSGALIYFKFSFMKYLISILAFFSLTVSYLVPIIYTIRRNKTLKTKNKTSLMVGITIHSDVNVDMDLKGTQKLSDEHRNKIMEDYFATHANNNDQSSSKGRTKSKNDAGKMIGGFINFLLILVFVTLYGLIIYNFAYHTIKA